MTFDFNVKAKEVNGQSNENSRNLREVLLEFLGTETKGNTVKLCYWYGCLMNEKPLELDEPDAKELVDVIKNTERLWVFIKKQLLEILEKKD